LTETKFKGIKIKQFTGELDLEPEINKIEERIVRQFVEETKRECTNCEECDFFAEKPEKVSNKKAHQQATLVINREVPDGTHLLWAKYGNFKTK